MLADLLDLVLPRSCIGCGREAVTLCTSCRNGLLAAHLCNSTVVDLPLVGAAAYGGLVRQALLELKERGQPQLAGVLGRLLAEAVSAAVPNDAPVLLVPVPSGRGAWAGVHAVDLLAQAAARRLRTTRPARVWRGAVALGRRRDQVGLGAAEREANLDRTMAARPGPPVQGAELVVVDDIVTTGATLAELVRALRAAGVHPGAAAVVAVASPRVARGDPDIRRGAFPRVAD